MIGSQKVKSIVFCATIVAVILVQQLYCLAADSIDETSDSATDESTSISGRSVGAADHGSDYSATTDSDEETEVEDGTSNAEVETKSALRSLGLSSFLGSSSSSILKEVPSGEYSFFFRSEKRSTHREKRRAVVQLTRPL